MKIMRSADMHGVRVILIKHFYIIIVCLATVFLKQHSVVDVIGAIILYIVLYIFIYVIDYSCLKKA